MMIMSWFWVSSRVFPAPDGSRNSLSGRFRPVRTHRSLGGHQFPPDQVEVGQGEQGEELRGVLG